MGEHQSHLEGLWKHRLLAPLPELQSQLVEGGNQTFEFLLSSQVMLTMLEWGPQFENHCSKQRSRVLSGSEPHSYGEAEEPWVETET